MTETPHVVAELRTWALECARRAEDYAPGRFGAGSAEAFGAFRATREIYLRLALDLRARADELSTP